ncbi:MAG: hypothetical protein ACK40G_11815 [Cytophagaceae bacterium]
MTHQEAVLIIDNLELIAHKANEIIFGKNRNIYYSDFYHLYENYRIYLLSLNEDDKDIKAAILSLPKINKTINPGVFYVLVVLGIGVSGLWFIFGLVVYSPLLFILWLSIFYLRKEINKSKLSRLIVITQNINGLIKGKYL